MSRPLSGSASARTPSSSSSRSMTASEPSTRLHKASEVKRKTPLAHPSRGLLPTAEHSKKNWRHLEGNKSVLHSPNWALFFSPYFFSQPALCFLRCTRLHWEIKSAGYLFYCTCIFFTFSALLRLNLKACRNSFFYPTSAAVFTAPTFKNDATFSPSVSPLALRTPASVQSSGEQLGDVWHHRRPQPILRWQWYHRGNTPLPPLVSSAASFTLWMDDVIVSAAARSERLTQRLTWVNGWINDWRATKWQNELQLTDWQSALLPKWQNKIINHYQLNSA